MRFPLILLFGSVIVLVQLKDSPGLFLALVLYACTAAIVSIPWLFKCTRVLKLMLSIVFLMSFGLLVNNWNSRLVFGVLLIGITSLEVIVSKQNLVSRSKE
jgi:hypothetical protein